MTLNVLEQHKTQTLYLYAVILAPAKKNMFNSSTTWDRSTTHPKFDPTRVRSHDLQIMTVHFMSLRRLL